MFHQRGIENFDKVNQGSSFTLHLPHEILKGKKIHDKIEEDILF
jgi:hypothetical protein